MFVKIQITEEILNEATNRAKKTMDMAQSLTPKFQTNELNNKTVGFIGEAVFEKWLKDNSIEFTHEIVYGKADTGDFIVNGKVVEVKTGKMTWAVEQLAPGYKFFIAEQQLGQYRDIYVNIQLDNNLQFAYITGFITFVDTKKYSVFQTEKMANPARGIPLGNLTEICKFCETKEEDSTLQE